MADVQQHRHAALGGFWGRYPEFLTTSEVSASPQRLAFRYNLMIKQNEAIIKGKRCIDIASHDGRWTFAALKGAGAAYGLGIEPRADLVARAHQTFVRYDVARSSYDLISGDSHVELPRLVAEASGFDVGLCLGFLYHTPRPLEILTSLSRLGCSTLIVDTAVLPNELEAIVRYGIEDTGPNANLYAQDRRTALTSVPSLTAVHYFLRELGYTPRLIVPEVPIPAKFCDDYRDGRRFTVVGQR